MLKRLHNAGFQLNPEKCKFCVPELRYLWYIVNKKGLPIDPEKVAAILNISVPLTTKEIRRIIEMASWYRRFISNFSTLLEPITALLKKNAKIIWTEECNAAFKNLKEQLSTAPVLSSPDYEHGYPFYVQTDASNFGLGAVLTHNTDKEEQVICFLSRSLNRCEKSYFATEKMLSGIMGNRKITTLFRRLSFYSDYRSSQSSMA